MVAKGDIRLDARYPIGEAAKLLGITPRHLLRLANKGVVKYKRNKLNGRKYFLGVELAIALG